jgi:hypothetical protein
MNAFQSLIKTLLEREGFWVRSGFKVNLTKGDKLSIGHPTCPRWEIDIVAYKGATNELWLMECKSHLDSWGVKFCSFLRDGSNGYRLFTDASLRRVVTNRVVAELEETGSCLPAPAITLCLAAGKIRSEDDQRSLREHFKQNGWILWDDERIRNALRDGSNGSYEDDVARVVTTFLLRRRRKMRMSVSSASVPSPNSSDRGSDNLGPLSTSS